jgi:hypothetical protein
MRRVLGVVLTGLGAFLLVLALLFRFYLPGQVIKFPLNEYTVSDLTGTNVTYFSNASLKEVTGATIRAASTVQGDVAAGNSSTAVWQDYTGVFDITSGPSPGTPIGYSSERIAFNRRTGLVQNCCGAAINNKPQKMSGQEFVWPIGTQKKNYQVFDTSLLKPETAKFTGTSNVDGMNVDVFVEHVVDDQVTTQSVPGSLVGMKSQANVTLPEDLTATNTYYVDPDSGSPLKVVENQTEFLRNPSTGASALTLLHATLTSTPKTIASSVSTAKSSDNEIAWVQDIGPLIGGVLGLLLLVLGVLLVLGQYEEYYEYEDEDAEVPADA